MADHAILDLGEDDLQFTTNNYKPGGSGQQNSGGDFTQFPTPSTERDTSQLITEDDDNASSWRTSNFLKFEFYQQFFDVDTGAVKDRVLYSMVPLPGKSFLQHHIRPKPDLYGPFWVCVTLVFSIAISGNMATYLQKSFEADEDHPVKWHYDFHKVSVSAMVVFSYASLLPAGLYGFLWWAGQSSSATISFLELVCLYGYSLTIYIPVSLLWLIQISWWQWLCVMLGAGLSGVVLFTPIWPAVRHQAARSSAIIMIIIVSLHLLLAVGFMLYFFHVPGKTDLHNTTVTVAPASNVNGTHLDSGASVVTPTKTGGEGEKEERSSEKDVSESSKDTGDTGGTAETAETEKDKTPSDQVKAEKDQEAANGSEAKEGQPDPAINTRK